MTTRLLSGTLWGIEGRLVEVEVDVAPGLPTFAIVGMPATVVREARERVRAAIRNAGFRFPIGRVTVNLAPAELPKPQPVFDLAIALGILHASGQLPGGSWQQWLLVGELSLDGALRPVPGLLPLAAVAETAGCQGIALGCSGDPPWEGRWISHPPLVLLKHLTAAVAWARGEAPGTHPTMGDEVGSAGEVPAEPDLAEIRGQREAKRALEIAAAGGHGVLLFGPPGTGKTLLARALHALLPPLDEEEQLEVARIYSAAGRRPPSMRRRPLRQPHHSVPRAALVGGGPTPAPGEASLAHCGVLLLDELPLFRREAVDALREPLEDGVLTITRLGRTARFPCRVLVVATCNPCRCGYFGDPERSCRCSPWERQRYWATMPGPILDRIDLFVAVPRVEFAALSQPAAPDETTAAARERVLVARRQQAYRFRHEPVTTNAEMGRWQLERYCRLDPEARALLAEAYDRLHLSVRAHDRVLRVARTIADLEASPRITAEHVAEALAFRMPALF